MLCKIAITFTPNDIFLPSSIASTFFLRFEDLSDNLRHIINAQKNINNMVFNLLLRFSSQKQTNYSTCF